MADSKRSLPLPHLRELDGIRGIAVLLVFFHHLCSASIYTDQWDPIVLTLRRIFVHGSAGVDVFFVLSGFLITSLLIRDRTNAAYYKDFYWKRALRILPLYLVCLLGVLFFIPGAAGYVVLSALFIANFANVFHVMAHGPFWSLAIEEQFYLIWPTVVRRRSVDTLSHWAIAIALVSVVLRFVAASHGHYNYFLTFFRCDGLAAGALIACQFERHQRAGTPLSERDPYFIGAIAAAILLFFTGLIPYVAERPALSSSFNLTGITLLCAGCTGLVVAHTGCAALAPLRSRLLTFFGLISYALYMVQLYVLLAYEKIAGTLPIGDTRAYFIRIAVVLAATIAVCLFSRYVIELPALSLRKRVLSRPAPKAETQDPLFTR
jgi:peptidoglycan/LPS O-acetylase OafA/YrhL